ncbi:MAG: glycosyltransferase family 39 protein [bacterium]|nr:glycosyltransferase family 39 protein [bacterium]
MKKLLPQSFAHRIDYLIVLLVALILRLAASWYQGFNNLSFGDAADYIAAAQTLCDTADYPLRSSLPFFRAPGLPLTIAFASGCHVTPMAAKLVLIIADSLTCLIIYSVGMQLSRRTARLAALVYATSPFFIWQTVEISTEPLFTLLLLTSLSLLLSAQSGNKFFFSGAFLAIAALTRPFALLLIPLWLWSSLISKKHSAAFLVLGIAVTFSPWIVFNYSRSGEFILVNDAGMYNLWRSNSPAMMLVDDTHSSEIFLKRSQAFEHLSLAHTQRIYQQHPGTAFSARSDEWKRMFISDISESPTRFVRYLGEKSLRFWRPWLNPLSHSKTVVLASAAYFIFLYTGAFAGWLILFRSNRSLAIFILFFCVTAWAGHVPFQVVTRFRTSLIDPLAIVLCADCLRSHRKLHHRNGSSNIGVACF